MADQRIGVMQGRLSPRPGNRLQAFPHQSWPEQFAHAKRLGFSYLEWLYEAERAHENPIASSAGRAAIRACAAASGLPVGSVCADYIMILRFDGFFGVLASAGYVGDFLTQHYFDADSEASAAHSLGFVRDQLRARRAA